jgi:hydroxymethylpyrimidine/phosphomethylpyrimidine kinase
MIGRVLSIAGSDSGGGAGIQADIKTVTALGGYAATAITALTDQNTLGVHGVHAVPPQFIADQIKTVLEDIGADVVKTGMLASAEIASVVADTLETSANGIPRVIDPVMAAKGGHRLIDDDAIAIMVERLVAGAALITPNLPEAQVMTGLKIATVDDMYSAVDALRSLGSDAVLLKGGHLESETLIDLLITADHVHAYESPRLNTQSTHGTGCTLASAIATGLAQNLSLHDAVDHARTYVFQAIMTAPGLGNGHGPLNHGHPLKAPVLSVDRE